MSLGVMQFVSSITSLIGLTLIAVALDLMLGLLGLRFHLAALGILLGHYFLRPLDNKILNMLRKHIGVK